MTIEFGHRRLILQVVARPTVESIERFPMAHGASDQELASLNSVIKSMDDQARWQAHGAMYGAGWPR